MRAPAANIHPKDPILGPIKGFIDYVRHRLDAELPELLTGTKQNWNPPNVASGSATSTTVTVLGAGFYGSRGELVAMPAYAAITAALPAGCALTAHVTAKDEATVTLLNLSGGAVNIGILAELRVNVWRYGA